MTVPPQNKNSREESSEPSQRKRRAHQKSRRGCRNCKLRRVKCDETRPQCQKCICFRVSCNYDDPQAPDLQTSFGGTVMMIGTIRKNAAPPPAPRQRQRLLPAKVDEVPRCLDPGLPCVADDYSRIQLDRESRSRLSRFCMRTVLSIGTPQGGIIFQRVYLELACGHPYLMHAIQTLTALHDRQLSPSPTSRLSSIALYHLTRAAALLNAKLSAPLQDADRDALWATAALLGIAACSWLEASRADEAWPLTPRSPSDLDWIRMTENKAAVRQLTDPTRPESLFHSMAHAIATPAGDTAKIKIPRQFAVLCGLHEEMETNQDEKNPYYEVLRALAPLLTIECTRDTILPFLSFIGHLPPEFKRLLEERDARALLLLAYWYAKVGNAVWWLERRTMLEGMAICLYLERYHGDDGAIMELLDYPRMRCGLAEERSRDGDFVS